MFYVIYETESSDERFVTRPFNTKKEALKYKSSVHQTYKPRIVYEDNSNDDIDASENRMPEIVINLDDKEHVERFHRWGGDSICRVCIEQNGKKVYCHLSARISGDPRAGSTKGIHMSLTAIKQKNDVTRSLHAVPWNPIKK